MTVNVKTIPRKKTSLKERLYFPAIFQGMSITLRHFFAGLRGTGWLAGPMVGTTGPVIPAFAAVRNGPPSWNEVYAAAAELWPPGVS